MSDYNRFYADNSCEVPSDKPLSFLNEEERGPCAPCSKNSNLKKKQIINYLTSPCYDIVYRHLPPSLNSNTHTVPICGILRKS